MTAESEKIMNSKFKQTAKKLLSGFVAAAIAIPMLPQIPAFAETGATTYSYDGYDVEYSVYNEWDNGQTVQIKVTNTGDESILNWAFKYDAEGEINNLWNATVYDQQGEEYIIKNSGWNYEIAPGQSVNFGYTLVNDEFTTPDSFTLCSKRVEKTSGYEVDLNVVDQWDTGFKAELAITNTSDQPLEAWTVSFDSNFTINNLWDGRILENSDNHYTVASEMWSNPIASGESKTVGLVGAFSENSEIKIGNCSLTVMMIERNGDSDNQSFILDGFSEYGVNVLLWDNIGAVDIFRGVNDVFSKVETVTDANYYIDDAASPNDLYEYYISSVENAVSSNVISIETSSLTTDDLTDMPSWIESMMILEDDFSALNVIFQAGDSRNYVSKDIILALEGENGSQITWESSDSSVITNDGVVNRKLSKGFLPVSMHATLKHGVLSMVKSFELNVVPLTTSVGVSLDLDDLMYLNDGSMPNISYCNDGQIEYIDGIVAGFPVFSADDAYEVIKGLSNLLGIQNVDSEIKFDKFSTNSVDNIFYFSQSYNGIEVYGTSITVIANKETGVADYLYSTYQNDLQINTVPIITSDEAVNIVEDLYKNTVKSDPRLIIYDVELDSVDAILAWELVAESALFNVVYIDACSGKVIYTEESSNNICQYEEHNALLKKDITVNVEKRGFGPFSKYRLHDPIRNISILDGTKGANAEYSLRKNDWSDSKYDLPLAALNNTSDAYDFFNRLGWKGYDNKNSEMKVVVHYQNFKYGDWNDIANAFSKNDWLKFGDGNGKSQQSYAVAMDIVGHEFAHSVTSQKIGIQDGKQSGAIKEAYSDIFGELMDPKHDWLHGVDIWIGRDSGKCNRNLVSHSSYLGENYKSSLDTYDNGNVHDNSTVISHAAYIMSKNGIPDNDLTQIWYNSYDYFNGKKVPNFMDCRFAVTKSVDRLYGEDSMYPSIVRNAFDEVNVRTFMVTIKIKDAFTGYPLSNQKVTIESANMEYCDLSDSSCCKKHSCLGVSCDPDTCTHFCENPEKCTISRCCHRSAISKSILTDSHGDSIFNGITKGYHRIKISSDGYEDVNQLIYVDPFHSIFDVELESNHISQITGKVTIADSDLDMSNNQPLNSAILDLTKISGSTEITRRVESNELGEYSITNLPAGNYKLTIHKEGFIDVVQTLKVQMDQIFVYNVAIEVISDEFDGKGYASGKVYDTVTGEGVEGLTLNVYSGIHVGVDKPAWSPICTITSSSGGFYKTKAIDAGVYTIFVSDSRKEIENSDKYISTSFTIKVLGNTEITSQNGTVSNSLSENQLRIVLTWGAKPSDLDLHLFITTYQNGFGHVSYGNKTYYVGGNKIADLDLDARAGYGPETITIYTAIDGTYTFYVNDFSNNQNGASNQSLRDSGATVYVYSGNATQPIFCYPVPSKLGTVWKVFSYDSVTNYINSYNTISTDYS